MFAKLGYDSCGSRQEAVRSHPALDVTNKSGLSCFKDLVRWDTWPSARDSHAVVCTKMYLHVPTGPCLTISPKTCVRCKAMKLTLKVNLPSQRFRLGGRGGGGGGAITEGQEGK